MQKFNLHQSGEKRTMLAVIIVFFAALVLFSYWFTQS
jgi:hypothetical protein